MIAILFINFIMLTIITLQTVSTPVIVIDANEDISHLAKTYRWFLKFIFIKVKLVKISNSVSHLSKAQQCRQLAKAVWRATNKMWVVKALKAPVVDCPTQLIYICQHTNKKTRKLNPMISRWLYDEKKAGTWLCPKANQDQEGICFAKKRCLSNRHLLGPKVKKQCQTLLLVLIWTFFHESFVQKHLLHNFSLGTAKFFSFWVVRKDRL